MQLQVAGFLEHSMVNGEGFRSVLFVSGCKHACPGCHNKDMQDFNYGESISTADILQRIQKNRPIIDGVTFSGGEPFEQCEGLTELAQQLKADGLTLWCYSGYTYEVLEDDPSTSDLLQLIDVLIDGPFIEALADANLKYRGSSNQHIYSLENGKILACLDHLYDH